MFLETDRATPPLRLAPPGPPHARTHARQALRTRSLATTVSSSPSPLTQISTLPNGLTVATEASSSASTATVGVWIDAGSRAETDSTSGTAHFLEHMAFKGTGKRSQHQLELEVENLGAHLNAYTSREQTVYYAKSFSHDVAKSVEIISDILTGSKLDQGAIERERDVILREQQEVDKQLEEVVFDHLHAVAFQHQPLGRTILGPKENILSIQRDDLVNYIKQNYTADRMVLVGTGGVEHAALVDLASQHFGQLPTSQSPIKLGESSNKTKPDFIGAEVRVRDDTMPTCNVAIAVEGVGWNSPDYYPMLVAQSIMGNWVRLHFLYGGGGFRRSELRRDPPAEISAPSEGVLPNPSCRDPLCSFLRTDSRFFAPPLHTGPIPRRAIAPVEPLLAHRQQQQPRQFLHVLLDVVLGHRPLGYLPRQREPHQPGTSSFLALKFK